MLYILEYSVGNNPKSVPFILEELNTCRNPSGFKSEGVYHCREALGYMHHKVGLLHSMLGHLNMELTTTVGARSGYHIKEEQRVELCNTMKFIFDCKSITEVGNKEDDNGYRFTYVTIKKDLLTSSFLSLLALCMREGKILETLSNMDIPDRKNTLDVFFNRGAYKDCLNKIQEVLILRRELIKKVVHAISLAPIDGGQNTATAIYAALLCLSPYRRKFLSIGDPCHGGPASEEMSKICNSVILYTTYLKDYKHLIEKLHKNEHNVLLNSQVLCLKQVINNWESGEVDG